MLSSCNLQNITYSLTRDTKHSIPDNVLSFSDDCIFASTSVSDSEDTFYGGIVTGLTSQTLHTFICINSTFTSSTRIKHNSVYSLSLLSPPYSTNADSSSQSFTSRQTFTSPSSNVTFTNCTFTSLYLSDNTHSNGGAAIFVNNSNNLAVTSQTVPSASLLLPPLHIYLIMMVVVAVGLVMVMELVVRILRINSFMEVEVLFSVVRLIPAPSLLLHSLTVLQLMHKDLKHIMEGQCIYIMHYYVL